MYHYQLGISASEHDDFVIQSDQTNLLQSSSWAKIKDNWGNERVGFYQEDQLVAVASILIQPLPLGFSMLYIPRGPIMDYQNKELVSFVIQSLKKIAKQYKALFVKFDPSLFLSKQLIGQENMETTDVQAVIDTLTKEGIEWTGRTSDMAENTRQAIRTARNKGIQVQFGGTELLEDFASLMKKTEARKSIHLRGKDYYEKLLTTYQGQSYITLSTLDLAERKTSLTKDLEKNKAEAEKFTEKTKPGKVENNQKEKDRIEEELQFLEQHLQAGRQVVPLSGTLTLEFGGTSENVYAGMDDEFRRYQPAILTWYETAQHAFDRGASWQNMGGIENSLDGGLYHFKSKFNPVIEEFVGEFNLPTSPLYPLVNKVYKIRKKLRSK